MSARGHIRQRGRDRWEVRVSLGFDQTTGKRRITTFTVKGSRADAEKALTKRLAAKDGGDLTNAGKLTLGQFLDDWLGEQQDRLAPNTVAGYRDCVTAYIAPALG